MAARRSRLRRSIQAACLLAGTVIAIAAIAPVPGTSALPNKRGTSTTSSTSTTSTSTTLPATTAVTAAGHAVKALGIQPATLSRAEFDSLLDTAHAAGTGSVAVGVSFASLEPTGPAPAGEWSTLDTFVGDAAARGMSVRLQLFGLPDWARTSGRPLNATAPWLAPATSGELQKWADFVGRLTTHFGTKVAYYEIWNEPNITDFWYGGASPSAYGELLRTSFLAIKGANAQATVMFGGLSRNDLGFLKGVYTALDNKYSDGATNRHYFDILNVHPYSADRAPSVYSSSYVWNSTFGTIDENFTGFTQLKAYMDSRGESSKHIFLGEFGYTTVATSGFPAVDDATRAKYLTSAYDIARSYGYIDGLSWYYFYPTPWDPPQWTLLTTQGTSTATFDAFKAVPAS